MFQELTIVGRLGQDPELKYTASGVAYCNFSVACSKKFMKDNQQQEKTEWFSCVAFNKLAENINQYLGKGSLVFAKGEIETKVYDDKNTGEQKKFTQVLISNARFLSQKGEGQQSSQPPQQQRQQSNQQNFKGQGQQSSMAFNNSFTPDELPF